MSELPKFAGHSCWTSGASDSSSVTAVPVTLLRAARLLGLGGPLARRDRLVVEGLAVEVDRRAVRRGAHVVPHRRAVGLRGGGVDVVAEELHGEVVCDEPRASPVAPRWICENALAVDAGQSAWRTTPTSWRSLFGPTALGRNGVPAASTASMSVTTLRPLPLLRMTPPPLAPRRSRTPHAGPQASTPADLTRLAGGGRPG
jgi:hypothetical protein